MKIDLSKEQGTLVPLYFYRKPLGWPEQNKTHLRNPSQDDSVQ